MRCWLFGHTPGNISKSHLSFTYDFIKYTSVCKVCDCHYDGREVIVSGPILHVIEELNSKVRDLERELFAYTHPLSTLQYTPAQTKKEKRK